VTGCLIARRSWRTDGTPSARPSPSRYRRQDTLAAWPGTANGSIPSTRIAGAHSPARCLVLITDYMPGDGDIGAVSEDLRQALLQQRHVRAVGQCEHCQMHHRLLPHPLCRAGGAERVTPGGVSGSIHAWSG
jgi:hypothetical protein